MSSVVDYLISMLKAEFNSQCPVKSGMITHVYNSSTQEEKEE